MNISSFAIFGLFGTRNVHIPISKNRLILVGVNGIGKSTVLSMFYAYISLRWDRLREFQFDVIEIVLNDELVRLSKEEIIRFRRFTRGIGQYPALGTPRTNEDDLHDALEEMLKTGEVSPGALAKYSLTPSALRRLRDEVLHAAGDVPQLFSLQNYFNVRRSIKNGLNATVVYLPTYRRIEKELSTIVPKLEDAVRSYEDRSLRAVQEALFEPQRQPLSYIDLVQFGMADITHLISQTLANINLSARIKLNELSGIYLREIIRNEVTASSINAALNYAEDEIRSILDRVSEGALEPRDKSLLIKAVEDAKGHKEINERTTYLLHYLGRVVETVKSIEALEDPIRRFVDVCNQNYFIDKSFVYDTEKYSLGIRRHGGEKVELKDLSSGEKQVVSLFCHLYLGSPRSFVVLIDEPELSLSVDWQVSFLPDIMNTDRCKFLFAVTHSPFIHENEFDEHAVDLAGHMGLY